MNLKIGLTIKKLRTSKGITQEKLAEYLGVSCQAISKWESNNGYPDIELIPALSNYFNISSDELLGIDVSKNKEKIDAYIKQYFENSNNPPTQLLLMREAIAKFPNSFILLQALMYSLIANITIDPFMHKGFFNKTTVIIEQSNKNLLTEAIAIAERILNDCMEDSIRHSAIQVLCYYYPLFNKTEKAIQLANSMPPLYISRDCLFEDIYEGEEKVLQIQKNIHQLTDYLCSEICSIADPDSQQQNNISIDEKIHLFNVANKIYELVYENGDYNLYNCRLAYNYRVMAALAISNSNINDTLNYLEKAAEYAITADKIPINAPHTSLPVNRLKNNETTHIMNDIFHQTTIQDRIVFKLNKTSTNESTMLLKKLKQERYDIIRNTERFKLIVKKLEQSESK